MDQEILINIGYYLVIGMFWFIFVISFLINIDKMHDNQESNELVEYIRENFLKSVVEISATWIISVPCVVMIIIVSLFSNSR